jgi:hypothetical protein
MLKSKINKTEHSILAEIEAKYYMKPVFKKVGDLIAKEEDKRKGWKKVFDKLHDFMVSSLYWERD